MDPLVFFGQHMVNAETVQVGTGHGVESCLMEKIFQELPNWTFWCDEVSAGGYRGIGRSSAFGSNLELTGENADELFDKAKRIAADMERQARAKLNRF